MAMYITCDGIVSTNPNGTIECNGVVDVIEVAPAMSEEVAMEFILGTTVLFAVAVGVRLIRKMIWKNG